MLLTYKESMMLTHDIMKRENALPCDERAVKMMLMKMADEGYALFCMIAAKKGVDDATFLAQLDFLRYPIMMWEGGTPRAYKTILIETKAGLRAVFFANHGTHITQLYTEGGFLENYTFGVGEFFWLLDTCVTTERLAYWLCHEDRAVWWDLLDGITRQAHRRIDIERYDDFHGRVCRYSLPRIDDPKFGVLGILQVAEYLDKSYPPVEKKTIEQLCMMLENHYHTTGQSDRRVYCVINPLPWSVPVIHPGLRHMLQYVKNGYIVFLTSDLSQLSTGAERIANDIAEMGKTINMDFLLRNPKVNAALACEQALRVTLFYSSPREQPYCTNLFNLPDAQHPSEKGELDIGLNLISDDLLTELPYRYSRDMLFGMMERRTRIDLLNIRHKAHTCSEWVQVR